MNEVKKMVEDNKLKMLFRNKEGKNFMTPEIISIEAFNNNILELSEGEGFEHDKIYGFTHRYYSEEQDKFVEMGFSKMFRDKEKILEIAKIFKNTNACTVIQSQKEKEVCDELKEEQ